MMSGRASARMLLMPRPAGNASSRDVHGVAVRVESFEPGKRHGRGTQCAQSLGAQFLHGDRF